MVGAVVPSACEEREKEVEMMMVVVMMMVMMMMMMMMIIRTLFGICSEHHREKQT